MARTCQEVSAHLVRVIVEDARARLAIARKTRHFWAGSFGLRDAEPPEVPPARRLIAAQICGLGRSELNTYLRLGEIQGEPVNPLMQQLALSERSAFEDARAAGEALVAGWGLGEIPAGRLAEVAEEKLGLLVLHVDAPPAISGAACHHPRFNTVLINRREPDGRRNYDFAHETFHVLTWRSMPPRHVDEVGSVQGSKAKRVEQLADNFASALLMPQASLGQRWERRGEQEIHDWLNATASEFQVTAVALYWRLRHLGWLSAAASLEVDTQRLTWNGLSPSAQTLPSLFSRQFSERLRRALKRGDLSVRRAAGLLDCTVEDLEDLFKSYGMEVPFDL